MKKMKEKKPVSDPKATRNCIILPKMSCLRPWPGRHGDEAVVRKIPVTPLSIVCPSMIPSRQVVAAAVMRRFLNPIHEVAAGDATSGGTAATVGVVALLREEVLNGHLGRLGHGELALAAVRAAEDVGQRHAGAAVRSVLLQNRWEGRGLEVRLHGGQGWSRVVLQG